MRKPSQGAENVQTLNAGAVQEYGTYDIAKPNAVVGSAVSGRDREVTPDAPKRVFRVVRGGVYLDQASGSRARVHEGKECDTQNFDIRAMQKQGIRFSEVDAGEAGSLPLVNI